MASSKRKQDMDSILDAALDELACSDSDDEIDAGPLPSPTKIHVKDRSASNTKNDEASRSNNSKRAAAKRFGPEPPPAAPSFPSQNLTSEEAELAASLEGMMQQFVNFNNLNLDENDVNGMQDAERAMEEMFQQMMGGMMPSGGASPSPGVSGGATGIDVTAEERSRKVDVKGAEKKCAKSGGKKSSIYKQKKKKSKGMVLLYLGFGLIVCCLKGLAVYVCVCASHEFFVSIYLSLGPTENRSVHLCFVLFINCVDVSASDELKGSVYCSIHRESSVPSNHENVC
jgi:hypothetical protein